MELPESLLESTIEEQKIYFFTDKAPVGIPDHMHVCIKVKDKILLFSTCTSQMDTVYKLGVLKGWNLNTFPCLKKNEQNNFDEELTFVNCNNIIPCDKGDFIKYLKNGFIRPLDGILSNEDMKLISKGVHTSIMVPQEIKNLF